MYNPYLSAPYTEDVQTHAALAASRAHLRDNARIEQKLSHFDLSESRIFALTRSGDLEVDAVLHPEDYGDLVAWRMLGVNGVKYAYILGGFFVGAVTTAIIALALR